MTYGIYGDFILVVLLVIYAVLYFRHLKIYKKDIEKDFNSRLTDNLKYVMSVKTTKDISLSHRMLYGRIVEYMEEKKPYLSPVFGLEEMARAMYTNTGYVSKVINNCSGTNFSQFVNRYRVNYAMDLFKSDTSLKVMELGQLSGFNTKVTFNMAFKMIMNVTPGEWCRNYVENMPLDSALSNRKESQR